MHKAWLDKNIELIPKSNHNGVKTTGNEMFKNRGNINLRLNMVNSFRMNRILDLGKY